MECRDLQRADQRPASAAMGACAPAQAAEPVEVLRQAVIAMRFRRPAATAALLAELAFPTLDDRRRS